jgi:hypothetical protein
MSPVHNSTTYPLLLLLPLKKTPWCESANYTEWPPLVGEVIANFCA